MPFFLRCFDIVSLSLVFSSFVMMFPGIIFFVLSVLGDIYLESINLSFSSNLGNFWPLFFQVFFLLWLLSPVHHGLQLYLLDLLARKSLGFSLKSFIMYALKIDHFYSSIFMFKFTNSFVISILLLSPSVSFLFQTFYFPILEFFPFFLKSSFHFSGKNSYLLLISGVFSFTLWHSYNCFMPFGSFNLWIILSTAPIDCLFPGGLGTFSWSVCMLSNFWIASLTQNEIFWRMWQFLF